MGDIINIKDYANSSSVEDYKSKVQKQYNRSQTKKRNIKNNPSRTKHRTAKGMGKKIAMLAAVGVLVLGGMTACEGKNKNQADNQTSRPTHTTTITQEKDLEDLVKEAEQDFLEKYINGYNEKYKTEYEVENAEILANSLASGYVYTVNGKRVTPGQYPDITRNKLSQLGTVGIEEGHDKVIQIAIDTEEGLEVLATYNASTLETLYTGTQIDDVLNGYNVPEVEEFVDIEVAESMFGIALAKGNENEASIKQRLNKYKQAIKVIEERTNGGYEIGD